MAKISCFNKYLTQRMLQKTIHLLHLTLKNKQIKQATVILLNKI